MRAERGGDADVRTGDGGRRLRQVVLDVVPAAEQQRYEDGRAVPGVRCGGETGEGVVEQRLVQLDVAEPYVEAGAQFADAVEELEDGVECTGLAAAVGDGDEDGPFVRGHGLRVPFSRTWLSWVPSWSVIRESS